jgi:hypothetical protein
MDEVDRLEDIGKTLDKKHDELLRLSWPVFDEPAGKLYDEAINATQMAHSALMALVRYRLGIEEAE